MSKNNKIPKYLKILIKDHPEITSGRKNFDQHNYRIMKTVEIIKQYFKKGNFVCASDGFFPFVDSINLLNRNGCNAVAQPGGSINDEKIISFSIKNKISLYFTKNRLFKHWIKKIKYQNI